VTKKGVQTLAAIVKSLVECYRLNANGVTLWRIIIFLKSLPKVAQYAKMDMEMVLWFIKYLGLW